MNCVLCNWPLDELHIFNVNCGAANSEYEQIVAEVRELQAELLTPEEEAACAKAVETVKDIFAWHRFKEMMRKP